MKDDDYRMVACLHFFRTTLLHTRSGEMFKSLLLVEMKNTLDARQKLREAMVPLDETWDQFLVSFGLGYAPSFCVPH